MTIVTHGTLGVINGKRVSFGSVAGYAQESGADAAEWLARAIRNGHKLHWVNLVGSTISSSRIHYEQDRVKWANAIVLNIGDIVLFDGITFRLEPAPNHNVELVKV